MNTSSEKVHPTTTKTPPPPQPSPPPPPQKPPPPLPKPPSYPGKVPPPPPPTKAQQPRAPVYRPRPPPGRHDDHHRRHHRRRFCSCRSFCSCIFWTFLVLLAFLAVAGILAGIFYGVFRPRLPSFEISSMHISQLNLTSPAQFTSKFNLTIITTNPNDKIIFYYDPIDLKLIHSHQSRNVIVSQGSFPGFVNWGQNTTSLFALIRNQNNDINMDDGSLENLKSDLNKKNGLDLKIEMNTQIRVEIGGKVKSMKVGLRASCDGIKVVDSKKKVIGTVEISNSKCKVQLVIKIFEWDITI